MNIAKSIKRNVIIGSMIIVAGFALVLAMNAKASGVTVRSPRDCSEGSVIICGALSTEELVDKYNENEEGDLPEIFNAFGISSSDVTSLNQKVLIGEVRSDDTVWVDGKLIGVNAETAGRVETSNSVPIPNTEVYRRPQSDVYPGLSGSTIKVYIGYEGNQPSWGIIASCGNPLTWDKPEVDIQKTIAKSGSTEFGENVSLKDGEKAVIRIQVSETTGNADLHDVKVSDTLPAGMTFVPGSMKIDGENVEAMNPQDITLPTVAKDSTVTVTFEIVVKLLDKVCGTNEMTNKAVVTTKYQPEDSDTAKAMVSKDCNAKYSCDDFKFSFNDRKATVSFVPAVSNGAEFKDATIVYSADGKVVHEKTTDDLTDGKVVDTFTFSSDAKNVKAAATVRFNVPEGDEMVVKSVNCEDKAVLAAVTTPPTTLPDTGAGETLFGMLTAMAGAGAIAHRRFTLKRQ